MISRRDFGRLLIAPAFASAARAVEAATGSGKFDISYFWAPDPEACLEHMEDVADALGEAVAKNLRLVVGASNYGVIWDRDAEEGRATELAAAHNKILTELGIGQAAPIRDQGYDDVFNVSYALTPSMARARTVFDTVYRRLGAEVGKDLVIEKTDQDNYVVAYKRYGTRASSASVASNHARALRGTRIGASIAAEVNNEQVFGESSYLEDKDEREARAPPPPRPRAPATRPPPPAPSPPVAPPREPRERQPDVEDTIERVVRNARNGGGSWSAPQLARDETTAWLVYDLQTGTKLAGINESRPMQCASMVKPFVALAYFHQVKAGELRYNATARRRMTAMLQKSNNGATNWVMRQVGGPDRVQQILKQNYGRLFDDLSIREFIPAGGRTYQNKASAQDYCNLMIALHARRLPSSAEMLRIMSLPKRNRLYSSVPAIPTGTIVYDKTGTTARCVGDFGIVSPRTGGGKRRPYVMVAIIEKDERTNSYRQWAASRGNVIRAVSGAVYQALKPRYDFA